MLKLRYLCNLIFSQKEVLIMINLIIVDDEETTRNGLAELIPWNELGIDAVKTAKNGLDALELAESFTPSIMLCDVRMPKMDGIELAKRIRELYPLCEILFLSGFSDKEYLKSAIQVSAVDYLEKPVDIETLMSVFSNIIKKLLNNIQKASDNEKLKSNLSENIHLLRQEIVQELLYNDTTLNCLSNKYGPEILKFSNKSVFSVVSIKFNWVPLSNEEEKSIINKKILKMLNTSEICGSFNILSGFTNDKFLVLIIDEEVYCEDSKFNSFLYNVIELLLQQSDNKFSVSIGCSNSVKDTSFISESYKATLISLKQQFYHGINKVFYTQKPDAYSYEIDKELFTKFKKLLRNNSITDALNLIHKLTLDISASQDNDINKIKNIYFDLVRILLEVTMKWDSHASGEDNENKYIWQEIDSQVTLRGLSDFLISNLETIYRKTDDNEASIKKVTEIKKYILCNYTDNQISIQSISDHTSLSQTYLCAFFKKSTGMTLNEYITELRIEKAKELLKDSRIKLYEITSSIGFTDVNYFSTLFKRHTGFTPSELREKNLYDKNNI